MPLEIRNVTVYLNNPNQTVEFEGAVKQYTAAITGFNMSYAGGKGHDVQTFKLSLQSNKDGNTVDFKVTGQLSDNGGNTVDAGAAWVTIGVIAETVTESDNVTLGYEVNIAAGENSVGIPLAQSSTDINAALLAGFNLSYGSGNDHDIQQVGASASVSESNGEDFIKAEAGMKDGGSNSATTATIDGGVLATFKSNAGVVVQSLSDQQASSAVKVDLADKIPSGYKLTGQAMAVLTAYSLSYGGNTGNDINTIGAGLIASGGYEGQWAQPGMPSVVDGTFVNLPTPKAYMYDLGMSNHAQDDDESGVDILVIATIEPA